MSKEQLKIHRYHQHEIEQRAALYRDRDLIFADWAAGYGVIRHRPQTQVRVYELVDRLHHQGAIPDKSVAYRQLQAADRLASAAMWLVVHMTYAENVYRDGRDLTHADFKRDPQGHTGGSLNMVPGYVGYLLINALSGVSRHWLMGQGHCVAAVDATNLLVGNSLPIHHDNYPLDDAGLTRFVRDFYAYHVSADGRPASPLGSHVNVNTAGASLEGGYLGFAGLHYIHQPLPGERLVAFLSDGAFEEQRGSDWAPRWWRAEDSGLVSPIMIANGRRIDQRTTTSQQGGTDWLREHLIQNSFDPIIIDGTDPADFAWVIFEMEQRLEAAGQAVQQGWEQYPVPLPYAIAEAPKGYGFPGQGSNLAHGTPLGQNPRTDAEALRRFNEGARRLWVPDPALAEACQQLCNHKQQGRPHERELGDVTKPVQAHLPKPNWSSDLKSLRSPMDATDETFVGIVQANPELRPRVGNPDELRSNRMNQTLDLLKHRVTDPEDGMAEAIDGKVITALNEEAVVSAALANRQGLNMVVSYEAFAVKMLGAIRQSLIFARHQVEAAQPPGWLSVPIVQTSHLWENGKNEQSHQDPTLCEALMSEMSDRSRVLFPADWNSAMAATRALYQSHGQIWSLVQPKSAVAQHFTTEQAETLVRDGALRLSGDADSLLQLIAVGSYQLVELKKASVRLQREKIDHTLIYLLEPGRFRQPRDRWEADSLSSETVRQSLFPSTTQQRLLLGHMRPEALLGVLRPLDLGPQHCRALGYLNRGGTLDVEAMLYANRCTWAHCLAAISELTGAALEQLLSDDEIDAVQGRGDPYAIIARPHRTD